MQARAAHEAWEVAVSRLDLDWMSHENRCFYDPVVDARRSREGAQVTAAGYTTSTHEPNCEWAQTLA